MAHSAEVTGALDELLASEPHVVGYSGDEVGDERGIRLYVDKEGLRTQGVFADVPVVDVVVVGTPRNKAGTAVGENPRTKVRPVIGGISISGAGIGALGYFVVRDGKIALLGAAHVLLDKTPHVIQPARDDGGKDPQDLVAQVVASVFVLDKGVDAAAATLESGIAHTLTINELQKITGTKTVTVGTKVQKSGPNTTPHVTTGTVSDINATAKFPEGIFHNLLKVDAGPTPFSAGGDSGSLVVVGDKAVGVLKGGSDTEDWVCKIDPVLAALNATLAT